MELKGIYTALVTPFKDYDVDEEEGTLLGFNSNNLPVANSIWKLPKYVGARSHPKVAEANSVHL